MGGWGLGITIPGPYAAWYADQSHAYMANMPLPFSLLVATIALALAYLFIFALGAPAVKWSESKRAIFAPVTRGFTCAATAIKEIKPRTANTAGMARWNPWKFIMFMLALFTGMSYMTSTSEGGPGS